MENSIDTGKIPIDVSKNDIGRKVKVLFEDRKDHIVPKEGTLTNIDSFYLYVDDERLLHSRVIRWEVLE